MGENLHAGHRQRLRDRYRVGGLAALEEHEQLELLLFYAIPRCDTNATAHRLLNVFGSIPAIIDAPLEEIERVQGVGKGAGTFFRFLRELYAVYQTKDQARQPIIKKPVDAAQVLMGLYSDWNKEMVTVLLMNHQNRLIHAGVLNANPSDWVNVDLRTIIHMSFNYEADKIILGHNHPSGDVRPSCADVQNSLSMEHNLARVGITMIDHIIVHNREYYSMFEHGEIKNENKNNSAIALEYSL
ncbi:MAG: RadC family protein [Clostridia bacterium]|nr:RadC family protein [Clostridia bacterium]